MESNWRLNLYYLGVQDSFWSLIAGWDVPGATYELYLGQKLGDYTTLTVLARPFGSSDLPVNIGEVFWLGPSFAGYDVFPD